MTKERSKRIIMEGEINPKNQQLWNSYKRAKRVAGRSEKTLYNYECDVMQFFKFLNVECFDAVVTDITEEEVENYIGYCLEQGNNEKRIRRRISSISSFFIYLKKKRKIEDNWCEYIERPSTGEEVHKRTFLTEEQLANLKQKLKEQNDLQLRVYIELGLVTMARSNEIAQMKWSNTDLENRWITDIKAKGNKVRKFRISEEVAELLKEWKKQCEEEGINTDFILFTRNNKGEYGRVYSSILSTRVKRAFKLIGLEGGYNHDLRHSMSNILKDRGMPITSISKLLGHSGVDVTINHYTIENEEKLAEEFDAML